MTGAWRGTPGRAPRALVTVALLAALAGCGGRGLDLDFRGIGGGFTTADAAREARTAPKPSPDQRGVISYPTYDVAVAPGGETVAQMATRLGFGPNELARYNGLPPETPLKPGEIIALPSRVAGGVAAPGAPTPNGTIAPTGGAIDVTTLAGSALDRVGPSGAPASVPSGAEPVRHQVQRGETAYTIARAYNVSVRALADWNGLDSALTVREGQYLLIPVVLEAQSASVAPTAPVEVVEAPGTGSATPLPPSAGEPLPDDPVTAAPAPKPASPDLGDDRTAASGARMAMPVNGKVVRAFQKGQSDGIDISAAAGTPVTAAADGTVAAITRDTDQVPILVVRHSGNLLTVYAGIDGITVAKGDKVSRGQTIAKVRAADPSFLHFQVREGTTSVDPMGYLN
ncbi:MAG: M23 family metallopeptidase [Maritimibacter sp.]|nr:M23 family metallopeptidase [Maritimibacter sp.]